MILLTITGTVPVVESNKYGLDRTYGSLPVLVVKNFNDITVELLIKAYDCFISHVESFRYDHLLLSYWVNIIRVIQRTGSVNVYNEEHPNKNSYCSFM